MKYQRILSLHHNIINLSKSAFNSELSVVFQLNCDYLQSEQN